MFSIFYFSHVFYVVSKGLAVELSQKPMLVVVFSDFGGVWRDAGVDKYGGHHRHLVVVRGQKDRGTSPPVRQDRAHWSWYQQTQVSMYGKMDSARAATTGWWQAIHTMVRLPHSNFWMVPGLVLKVDVKGCQGGSSQLRRHCTQQENMRVHSEIRLVCPVIYTATANSRRDCCVSE